MPGWPALLQKEGHELQPGARPEALDAAEGVVGLRLPDDLRSLYMVSDGVFDTVGQWFVIWPVGMLCEQNTLLRNAGLFPGSVIAFGDDGTGAAFCMKPGQQGVSCWHPIDGSMQRLASDIVTFWRGWTDGTITT
jgi:cell wall assembly regulator SMI1